MKKTILAIAAFIAASAFSPIAEAAKLDPGSRARLRASGIGMAVKESGGVKKMIRKVASQEQRFGAFITLHDGYTAADLEEAGVLARSRRGKILLAELTKEQIALLEENPAVAEIRIEREVKSKMNLVRHLMGIDKIHAGEGLKQPYTGKGVIAGIIDGGFDPNHVNFKDAEGKTRIKQFTYFRPTEKGEYVTQNMPAERIGEIDTESDESFHGTHTLGIMAGGFKGKSKVAFMKEDAGAPGGYSGEVKEVENPYYGVAYDSDILVASGAGTDYLMALGFEEILNYAYDYAHAENRRIPVVVNLSLGTNIGPHDGSSILCRYMDEVSADPQVPLVICAAAGNEGDMNIALHKTLTAEDTELKTAFKSLDIAGTQYKNAMANPVYIYSDSADPFELQAVVISKTRNRIVLRIPLDTSNLQGSELYYVTEEGYKESDADLVDQTLARYFNGYLGVAGMLDASESGRYMAVVDVMLWDKAANQDKYVVGLVATGKAGQRLDIYTSGDFFELGSHGLDNMGFVGGGNDGTISDIATGKNIISVGSYNQRGKFASMDEGIYSLEGVDFDNNEVSPFSSWGTLVDGRKLPMVCAPGATVISSSNEYFLDKYNTIYGPGAIQATYEADGRKYSWHQCVGTSMSTPAVAGSICLWLEANPYLSYKDVQEIIAETAIVDDDVKKGNPIQWGAGKFDAYAGLKEALRRASGVEEIATAPETSFLLRELGGGRYEVFCAGVSGFEANLYSVAGANVLRERADGEELTISTEGLAPGVYVLSVNGLGSRKILVK